MIRPSDAVEAPVGVWRPIRVEFLCDCGGMFCEHFERITSLEESYVEIARQATAAGWLETHNRRIAPGCR